MPRIYTPKTIAKTEPYCLVPHMADPQKYPNSLSILTDDYTAFIDRLCGAERVISSSLHGIILAESYSIPAVLFLPEHMAGNLTLYKYEDYYFGTGRSAFPVAHTLEEALALTPAPLPDLEEQRNRLLAAFPCDLWK